MRPTSHRSGISDPNRTSHRRSRRQRAGVARETDTTNEAYRVGPGRPPKEYQFKPGQSGNPRGAKPKTSLAPDLKVMLERALNEKVPLRQGEQGQIMTKAAAGIAKLVNQFAEGDRHARRDLIALAGTLGVDLTAGQGKTIENALVAAFTADDEAIIADFLQRERVQPEHRDDGADVALNEDDSAKSVNKATEEESS